MEIGIGFWLGEEILERSTEIVKKRGRLSLVCHAGLFT